jgi:hypothetical protein
VAKSLFNMGALTEVEEFGQPDSCSELPPI